MNSERNTSLWVSEDLTDFKSQYLGLVINESSLGYNVVLIKCGHLNPETNLLIKFGDLPPKKYVIRWIREVDEDVFRAGLETMEDRFQ